MSSSPTDKSPTICRPIDRQRSRRISRIHPGEFLREDFLPDCGLDAEIERLGNVARARGRREATNLDGLDALLRETLRETWDSRARPHHG